MRDDKTGGDVQVWDPIVRVGHWILVAAFFVAYFTEDETLELHEWAGYVVGAYVVVRVIWGFAAPQHARFADFLFIPFKSFSYLLDLLRGRARRYIGHSPAGATMVFALLVMLTGTIVTGMAELARSNGDGPLALIMERRAAPASDVSRESVLEDEDETKAGDREESALLELHELFANLTLLLIVLHVAGVVVASWSHKENLVRSMITGRKRPDAPSA